MSAHTPGPWRANFEEAYFVTGPDLGRVAMMMNLKGAHGLGGRRSGDESAANCRLIAAAPELLEALQWYEAKAVQMGRAAIDQDSKLLLELMKEIAVEYGAQARTAIAKAKGGAA